MTRLLALVLGDPPAPDHTAVFAAFATKVERRLAGGRAARVRLLP